MNNDNNKDFSAVRLDKDQRLFVHNYLVGDLFFFASDIYRLPDYSLKKIDPDSLATMEDVRNYVYTSMLDIVQHADAVRPGIVDGITGNSVENEARVYADDICDDISDSLSTYNYNVYEDMENKLKALNEVCDKYVAYKKSTDTFFQHGNYTSSYYLENSCNRIAKIALVAKNAVEDRYVTSFLKPGEVLAKMKKLTNELKKGIKEDKAFNLATEKAFEVFCNFVKTFPRGLSDAEIEVFREYFKQCQFKYDINPGSQDNIAVEKLKDVGLKAIGPDGDKDLVAYCAKESQLAIGDYNYDFSKFKQAQLVPFKSMLEKELPHTLTSIHLDKPIDIYYKMAVSGYGKLENVNQITHIFGGYVFESNDKVIGITHAHPYSLMKVSKAVIDQLMLDAARLDILKQDVVKAFVERVKDGTVSSLSYDQAAAIDAFIKLDGRRSTREESINTILMLGKELLEKEHVYQPWIKEGEKELKAFKMENYEYLKGHTVGGRMKL